MVVVDRLSYPRRTIEHMFATRGTKPAVGKHLRRHQPVRPTFDAVSGAERGQIVVGLSGHTGSGKTTTARALQSHGLKLLATRTVLSQLVADRDAEVNRRTLQEIGREVHLTLGQRWLFEELLGGTTPSDRCVIDALRFLEDRDVLEERFGTAFMHLHI